MSAIASQITSLTIVYSTVYSSCRSKKTSKLRVTGLCVVNSPVTGEFTTQRTSNAENVSIWWRHHESLLPLLQWHPWSTFANYPLHFPYHISTTINGTDVTFENFRNVLPIPANSCLIYAGCDVTLLSNSIWSQNNVNHSNDRHQKISHSIYINVIKFTHVLLAKNNDMSSQV